MFVHRWAQQEQQEEVHQRERGGKRRFITDLEYEAAHPGAGRQHQENVREEHEVTLALLLANGKESSVTLKESFSPPSRRSRVGILPKSGGL